MNCPICNFKSKKMHIAHLCIKDAAIYHCDDCSYSYVECTDYNSDDIYHHQYNNAKKFGQNLKRNSDYLNYLISLNKTIKIKKLLEIGTPKNYDFLQKVNLIFKHNLTLYSYDLIQNDLPNYIKFFSNKDSLINQNIDIVFCIHTLEHIPVNQLTEFVDFIKSVSTYFVLEVPLCETSKRIVESSINPHYSFFTEKSIKKLFGHNININKFDKVLKFNNVQ